MPSIDTGATGTADGAAMAPPPTSGEILGALSSLSSLLDLLSLPPTSLNSVSLPSLPNAIPSLLAPLVPARNTAMYPDDLATQMGLPALTQAAQMENVKRYREVVESSMACIGEIERRLQTGSPGAQAVELAQRCMQTQGREGEKKRVVGVRKRRRVEDATRGGLAGMGNGLSHFGIYNVQPQFHSATAPPPGVRGDPLLSSSLSSRRYYERLPSHPPTTVMLSRFFTAFLQHVHELSSNGTLSLPPAGSPRIRLASFDGPPSSSSPSTTEAEDGARAAHSTFTIHVYLPQILHAFLGFRVVVADASATAAEDGQGGKPSINEDGTVSTPPPPSPSKQSADGSAGTAPTSQWQAHISTVSIYAASEIAAASRSGGEPAAPSSFPHFRKMSSDVLAFARETLGRDGIALQDGRVETGAKRGYEGICHVLLEVLRSSAKFF